MLALLLGLWAQAQAAAQTLIISGGGDREQTRSEYRDECHEAYLEELRRGIEPIVVAEDGTWDFGGPPGNSFPACGLADLEAAFQLLAGRLQPGDPVTIFISDHGLEPEPGEPAWNASFALFRRRPEDPPLVVSHRQFMDLLRRHIPATSLVRLVGTYCFAGGLHHIAFELPNVCVSTATTFSALSLRTPFTCFGNAFWRMRRNHVWGGDPAGDSLYGAHWGAIAADRLNGDLAQLSSMAYVDSMLGEGAYAPSGGGSEPGRPSLLARHARLADGQLIQSALEDPWPTWVLEHRQRRSEAKGAARPAADEDDWEWVEPEAAGTAPPAAPLLGARRLALLDRLKADLRAAFTPQRQAEHEREVAGLRDIWDSRAKEWKEASLPLKVLSYLPGLLEQKDLELKTDFRLSPYAGLIRRVDCIQGISRFLKGARAAEVDKFFQLLELETTPFLDHRPPAPPAGSAVGVPAATEP